MLRTALALALLAVACAQAGPLITVPSLATPPTVDGVLSPGEWDAASGPGLFSTLGGSAATTQPQVLLTYDRANLYVAARLPLPDGVSPRASVTQHDGSLWEDDAIEVFLAPKGGSAPYYQFIVNAGGAQWDSRGKDATWNAEWAAKTGRVYGYWCAELAIPFAALGVQAPADGTSWLANFAWDCHTPSAAISSWAPVQQGLHEPASFGTLTFRAQAPPFAMTALRHRRDGFLQAWVQWGPSKPDLKAQLTLTRGGEVIPQDASASSATGGREHGEFGLLVKVPQQDGWDVPGDYRLALTVTCDGQTMWTGEAPMTVKAPLTVDVEKYWLEGKLIVAVDATGAGRTPGDVKIGVQLRDADGKTCAEAAPQTPGMDGKLRCELDVKAAAAGKYQLLAELQDADGKGLYQSTLALEKPERPVWLGSKAGISDEVLAPWTPLRVNGTKVMPWGRTYEFGYLPFPRSVVTAGEEVLAGPITLVGKVDGREMHWGGKGCQVTRARGNAVTLASEASSEGLDCSGTVRLEYDGMIRSDFRLAPKGQVTVEALSLEVPIKPQYAKYLYHWPGRWGSAYNAGALPEGGFHGPFKPVFWLGDEQRGLCWFSESDRNFFGDGKANVIDIAREGDRVVLRVSVISAPQTIRGPLDYTFGFQATPVKPMTPDVWDYRISHAGNYDLTTRVHASVASVTYPAKGNLDPKQGTFECWVRPRFDPYPDFDPKDPGRGALNRNLFDLDLGGGAHVGFYWNIDDRGMRLYFKQGEAYPLLISSHPRWKQGEWHHVAFTWGEAGRIYIDGIKAAEKSFAGLPAGDLEKATISLGLARSDMDIDEVRVSSVARESFDLTQPPVVDGQTLLLDHLDEDFTPNAIRATSPAKGTGGVVSGGGFYEGRFGKALGTEPGGKPTVELDYLAACGVRTICFHEHWTDIQAYPATTHGDRLRPLVAACHERGIQLLLYHGYEMSDIAPEWDNYHDECLVYPRGGGYTRQPPQKAYIVCYRGPWQDFIADGLEKELAEYNTDGVYLDGTSEPWGCRNTHHGCGYVKPDGSIGTTYSIFATRDMMRRIYTIVKHHNPQGQVNVHQSTCMTIPTLSWATSYWDGEQFGGIDRGPFALEVLPLDAFRCEFMGHNWGVPAEFLCYNRPYTMHEAMAFTLLHDVLVRNNLGEESKLWKLMDDFGRKEADWLPYWRNGEYVRSDSRDLKVSLYNRPGRGTVAVISNLGDASYTGTVTFDLRRLQQPGALNAVDAMTGRELTMAGNVLNVALGPLDYLVVWLKGQ
jgi:hypothetical protein